MLQKRNVFGFGGIDRHVRCETLTNRNARYRALCLFDDGSRGFAEIVREILEISIEEKFTTEKIFTKRAVWRVWFRRFLVREVQLRREEVAETTGTVGTRKRD